MLALAAWAARRSKRAAALILGNALSEGTCASLTRFNAETGLFPLMSFRRHVRIGPVGEPVFLALGMPVAGVPQPERSVLIFLGLVPSVLNGISDISGEPARAL